MSVQPVHIFWFRRDLRLNDNHGLYEALRSGMPVLPIFIFDTDILDQLSDPADARVNFIHHSLQQMDASLRTHGSGLTVMHGKPKDCFQKLIKEHDVKAVYTNHDYETYANERDAKINQLLSNKTIAFKTFKDQCIFEKSEVVKDDGLPYTIFTPYSRKWKLRLSETLLASYSCKEYYKNFSKEESAYSFPSMEEIGFYPTDILSLIHI